MTLAYVGFEMKDCVFRNFFTKQPGGLFYVGYLYNFSLDGIDIYNSTALDGVC